MLIDSNIIIYASKLGHEFLHPLLADPDLMVSVVSYIETLGFHQLTETEKRFFTQFFENVELAQLENSVVERAVKLRQMRRMKLADALIAATALAANTVLVTRNIQDFDWISELTLLDPFKSAS
jgi:hypothetical protein